jgi:hypothetical protein
LAELATEAKGRKNKSIEVLTMTEFNLFSKTGLARRTDPDTSHLATEGTKERRVRHKDLALQTLYIHGGMTDFTLAEFTKIQQTSIGKRRKELCDAGLCFDSGLKRAAPSGSLAIIWCLTEEGRKVYEAKIKK